MAYSYRSAFLAVVLAYVAYHLVRTDSDLVLAHSSRRPDFWAGKVCLVTGASSGVGEALSVALASSGAKVILAARDTERLETVRRRCVGPDGTAAETRVMTMDASQPEVALADFAARAVEQFGRLDVFFNNAGTTQLIGQTSRVYAVNNPGAPSGFVQQGWGMITRFTARPGVMLDFGAGCPCEGNIVPENSAD